MIAVDADESLTSALARLGYAHAPGHTPGRRSIQRDGVEVLQATAHEVWDWLRATGQIAAVRPIVWELELVEHVATWAAEQGPSGRSLEELCDHVLAGRTDEELLLGTILNDPELAEVVERGRNLGWRSRHVG